MLFWNAIGLTPVNEAINTSKRPCPESPENLEATIKQKTRQIRAKRNCNSVGDLRTIGTEKKAPNLRKSVADRVLEALSSPEVINSMMPVLSQHITNTLVPIIESEVKKCVDESIKPLEEKLAKQAKVIEEQRCENVRQRISISNLERFAGNQIAATKQRDTDVEFLFNRVAELENRIESQEQYSRRTSLRFNNIPVPTDRVGRIIHPVNTDDIVLDIINNKLNLKDISINDIGRTHVIGKARMGKAQVIVRFLSYRTRQLVYLKKKELKNDPDRIFITENLTAFRTSLVKQLSTMKSKNQIHTYWTADGKILVKRSENGRKTVVKEEQDILDLRRQIRELDVECDAPVYGPEPRPDSWFTGSPPGSTTGSWN